MKLKIRFLLSPFFIAKFYLVRDIKDAVSRYHFNGKILDIGCGEKPYRHLFNSKQYVGIDFQQFSANKDFFGEKPDRYFANDYLETSALPYQDKSFDNVVCFQVLEHHHSPKALVEEVGRVLKSGGLFMITCPFLGGIHEVPNDFQRFTRYGLELLLARNNFKVLEIKGQGSVCSTISLIANEYINSFAAKGKVNYFFGGIFYLPFLFFQYLSIPLDLIFQSQKINFNYIIVAKNERN